MGLDTEIHLRGEISDELIEKINRRIRPSMWADSIDYPNQFMRDPEWPNIVRFMTLWRYWSPSYERGPWLLIAGVIRTVWIMAPDIEVLYGHDCEDVQEIITRKTMKEYWKHFTSDDGDRYWR